MAKRQSPESRLVKTSVLVDARTNALRAACAALKGQSRYAFAADAIRAACSGMILVDRRKNTDPVKIHGSADTPGSVDPDGSDTAA